MTEQSEGWRAGGVMLQHMPKASPFVANDGGSGEDRCCAGPVAVAEPDAHIRLLAQAAHVSRGVDHQIERSQIRRPFAPDHPA